jgi:hypothetical protein
MSTVVQDFTFIYCLWTLNKNITNAQQCCGCSNHGIMMINQEFLLWTSCTWSTHNLNVGIELSSAVFSMWPRKNISHIKFSFFFLATLTHKTKPGTANWWETTNSQPSLWLVNQKPGAGVRPHLLHSFLAGAQLCNAFYQPQQTVQKRLAKTILLSQTSIIWLLFIQF